MTIPSSTGIIACWILPVQAITNAIPQLMQTLQKDSVLPAALGITKTDRYPKVRSYRSKDGSWSIVGIAKGATLRTTRHRYTLCLLIEVHPQRCLQDCPGSPHVDYPRSITTETALPTVGNNSLSIYCYIRSILRRVYRSRLRS
jgi:hypothetical protein